MKFVGKYLIPITNSSESDNYYVYRGDLANQTMEDILSPNFFDNSTLENKCLLKINSTNGDGLYIISKNNNNIIINNNIGINSLSVESPNNTITQIGDSTISNQKLTVKLETNINKIVPMYNTYDDLPDPNTLPVGSVASVKQGNARPDGYDTSGIYQIVENSIKYWNYLGTYVDNYTIIYDTVFKVNTGTTANKIIQLDNNAKIPAVDASQTTVGTIVPENNKIVTNDSLNTTANKLQGQINTLLNIINSSNGLQPVMLYFDTNQTLSGLPTQNGYTCVDNDRVICTNQTNFAENLIYNVHPGAWTIETDSEKVNELLGAWTEIIKGTYNNSYTYLVSITPASGDVTPTSVTWSTPVPSGLYQAASGIKLIGSEFSASFETNTSNIKMDGTANIGSSNNIPRADHVHPSDTSKQNLILPATANNIVTMNVDGQVINSNKKFSTDVALSENSDNNISTEAVIKYNVDYLNNRINNLPVGAGQGVLYYLTNDPNGSYLTLSTIPKNAGIEFLFGTINVNSPRLLLGSFATALPLNKTTLDAGIWEFNFWCFADNTQNTTKISAEIYTLSNTNVETLLFEIDNNKNIGSIEPILYSISNTKNSYTILPTDKLLVKFYANTTRNQDVNIAMYYNSPEYYSHMHTPITVSHNQLSGLNGGDGNNQYYHLTQTQYNNVINQASITQNGYLSSTDFNTFKQNSVHNQLSGLNGGNGNNQYYHLTQTQYNNVINQASITQNGYLSSTDFNTFNNKQNPIIFKQPKITVFTTSGTWTPDPTALYVIIEAQGAGGGSNSVIASATSIAFSNSGGGGSYVKALFPPQTTSKLVTVGTGAANSNGGASSVAGLINAPGGFLGSDISVPAITNLTVNGTTSATNSSSIGTQTGGTLIHASEGGGVAPVLLIGLNSNSAAVVIIQNGGNSQLGIGGISGQDFSPIGRSGTTGTGYGSGAGGNSRNTAGTTVGVAGANGIVIIKEYYF